MKFSLRSLVVAALLLPPLISGIVLGYAQGAPLTSAVIIGWIVIFLIFAGNDFPATTHGP